MILTGSILLLAALAAVECYPINMNPITYNSYNQPLMFPHQPGPPPLRPQMYSSQSDIFMPLSSNPQQRFQYPAHQQPQNIHGFSQLEAQRHHLQQQQQPHYINQEQRGLQAPGNRAAAQQQKFYQVPQQAQQVRPIQPIRDEPVYQTSPPGDKDFLSSLQIIDTQGKIRELKDFGLGGTGNQPYEPELERQLRTIFDTINRDLEHAAFLPLDVSGTNQQQQSGNNRYNQNLFNQRPLTSAAVKPPHSGHSQQPQLPIHQQITPPAQAGPRQQQEQQLGYTFTQAQQHQFQFLKPKRAQQEAQARSPAQTLREVSKQNERPQPQQQVQTEQRSIEQLPLKQESIEQAPVKGPIEQVQQQQFENKSPQQASVKVPSAAPVFREPESQSKRLEPQVNQARQETNSQYQRPVEQQQPIIQQQQQLEQRPVQAAPIANDQQQEIQQQQGFDDEPAPLKSVERSPVQAGKGQSSYGRARPDEQQTIKQVRDREPEIQQENIEQAPLNQVSLKQQPLEDEQRQQQQAAQQYNQQRLSPLQPYNNQRQKQQLAPQQQQQQQQLSQQQLQFDEDQNGPIHSDKGRSKKIDSWVPIVQKQVPLIERQKFVQTSKLEGALGEQQQREEQQGFDEQRPLSAFSQQKQEAQVEQHKLVQISEPGSEIQGTAGFQPIYSQQQQQQFQPQQEAQAKAPGKQNKLKKSLNKSATTSPKSTLGGVNFPSSTDSFRQPDIQTPQRVERFPQQQQQLDSFLEPLKQQREEVPLQQQDEALAQMVEQQRQEVLQQEKRDDTSRLEQVPVRQDQYQAQVQQREEPTITTTTTTTTQRPILRSEQVKGRRVKLQMADRFRTPVQKARDQQTKIMKQQQQQQQQQEQQQVQMVDSKRPRQLLNQATKQTKQPAKESELVQQQQDFGEPQSPVFATTKLIQQQAPQKPQETKFSQRPKAPPTLGADEVQQKQEVNQQPDFRQVQEKDEAPAQQEPVPQTEEILNQQQENPVQQQQQQQQIAQQQEQPQLQEQKQDDQVGQQQVQQQKEEAPSQQQQQREEAPALQQQQQREELPAQQQQREEPQVKEDSVSQQQNEGFGQQQREEVPQQQRQESLSQTTQSQEDGQTVQKQDSGADQQQQQQLPQQEPSGQVQQQQQEAVNQQQEEPVNLPQEATVSQAQEGSIAQSKQTQQVTQQQPEQQRQEENPAPLQQQQQEKLDEEKKQEEAQQVKEQGEDQPQTLLPNQEKQQVVDVAPQTQTQAQEVKAPNDEETPATTTQRPPTRLSRPFASPKEENKNSDRGSLVDNRQEVDIKIVPTARPKWRPNQFGRHSNRLSAQKQQQAPQQTSNEQSTIRLQSKAKLINRQRQQGLSNSNSESSSTYPGQQQNLEQRYNSEGFMSAQQLLNTYNPLQFEPERISSLNNRAQQSSSQTTNVNSSNNSEESY